MHSSALEHQPQLDRFYEAQGIALTEAAFIVTKNLSRAFNSLRNEHRQFPVLGSGEETHEQRGMNPRGWKERKATEMNCVIKQIPNAFSSGGSY